MSTETAQRGHFERRAIFPTPLPSLPPGWSVRRVKPGQPLIATVAGGDELDCVAASEYRPARGKNHGATVLVRFTTRGEPMPWPADYLRPGASS